MTKREQLFEQTIRDYKQSLARIVATYELQPALQEELHQEILLAIWKALETFRGDSNLHTFIYRVAHNQAINHLSKHARLPRHESLDERAEKPAPIKNSSPELAAMENQKMQLVFNAMHRLPVLQRQLLTLSLEGLSYKELSEVTGLTESNVGVRLNRAKQALKDVMENHHV